MVDSQNNYNKPASLNKTLKWKPDEQPILLPIKMSLVGKQIPIELNLVYPEDITDSFERTFVEFAQLDSDSLKSLVSEILAKAPSEFDEDFFNYEIEELFQIPVVRHSTELVSLIVYSNLGTVQSVAIQLAVNGFNNQNSNIVPIISQGRDFDNNNTSLLSPNLTVLPIIPADFNDFPTTPFIFLGDADEELLRNNPNVMLQLNVFQEGARFGTDSALSMTIDSTRAGSVKQSLANTVVITTPEGNTLTLYLSNVGGFVRGDVVYQMDNAVPHIAGPGVDVYIDGGTGEQVFVDKFTYSLTDLNFDVSTNDIDVHILDDVPTANNNTNAVDETALFVNGVGTETAVGSIISDDDGFGVDNFGGDGGLITLVGGVSDGGIGDIDGINNGTIVINTTYGQLSVDTSNGNYTYTLVDASAVPDGNLTAQEVINYQLTDNDGDTATANLTISIDLNQAPVANDDAVATDEDNSTVYAAPGVLTNDTDPDVGDTMQVVSIDTTGTTGLVTFQADGQITYDPNGLFESLAHGQTTDDTFTYTIRDAEGLTDTATVTVTVTGINDTPVANPDPANGSEGNETVPSVAVTGNVLTNDTDVDSPSGDFSTIPQLTNGLYGTLILNGDGSFSYFINDANGTVNALNVGASINDIFNYTMSDNNPTSPQLANGTLTITINGTNDAPVALADVNSGNEGNEAVASLAMTGNVLGNDFDVDTASGDFTVTPQVLVGTYGTLTLNADGTYSYSIDDNNATVNALNVGASVQDIFNYTLNDNHPTDPKSSVGTLTLTINGTNDAPLAVADSNNGNEGNETTPSVAMTGNVLSNDSDVDTASGDFTITPQVLVGTYGTLTLNADGTYSYSIDDNNATVNALNIGGSVQDIFNYTIHDNNATDPKTETGTLTLTINGTNDAPVAVADSNSGNEGNETTPSVAMTGNVLSNDTDVDTASGDFTITPQVLVGTYGTLTLNADGTYSYSIDDNNATVNALNIGGSVQDIFNYTIHDNNATDPKTDTGTLTLTINGTNDAPVAVADSNSGNEGNETTPSVAMTGNVLSNDTDIDTASGDFTITPQVLVGAYGTLTLNVDGTYSYSIDDNNATVNALNIGGSVQDIFNYTIHDNNATDPKTDTGTLTLTINGTNDAPVISNLDGETLNYVDAFGAQLLNQGAPASVTDIDSSDFSGGVLRVEITTNAQIGEDVLSVRNTGVGVGEIGFDGTDVSYEGTVIGSRDLASTNILLLINLNANADPTGVSALVNAVTYDNTNGTPDTSIRSVQFSLTDGDGGTSQIATVLVDDLDIDAGIGAEVDEQNQPEEMIIRASDILMDVGERIPGIDSAPDEMLSNAAKSTLTASQGECNWLPPILTTPLSENDLSLPISSGELHIL